ncbi:MAG: RNA-binding transcriptional accessory protein [Deltaproteobacteria bacterium]|nr:RNA-binding transcriptional accessory protein [Deltaproteobacteria bacterium]
MTQATSTATASPPYNPVPAIAVALQLPAPSVASVVALLEGGATVPFIARYRKEATGGLDEVQIRNIEEKRAYVLELEARRATILDEIGKQGKLTDALRQRILAAGQKQELEDLYLPYKPKRRTRAMIARERGLEALGLRMLAQPPDGNPETEAAAYVDAAKEVPDVKAALQGARDIVAETASESADVRTFARSLFLDEGEVTVEKAPDITAPTKFEMYYDFREPCRTIPSHRFLAVRRGEVENVLRVRLAVDEDKAQRELARLMKRDARSPWAAQMDQALAEAWKRLIAPSVETDVRVDLKLRADREAVDIFAQNLRALLLAAPLGPRAVIGIDPGQRTGCKVAVVDQTGKLLDHTLLMLVQGEGALHKSEAILLGLVERFKPVAIAVGNGTHGRETESFVRDVLKKSAQQGIFPVMVNEAGASVYSASDVAREEFPDLDLTVRGAISIARRLQDPLAELVKVDPKSIGVGQYQHDVFQPLLSKKLDEVVESCVNQVGVDINTASASLLKYVAGIGPSLAKKIVEYRNQKGAFASRAKVKEVSGLGPRAFEQCAGFLRIRGGAHPLDASAVHPERYALVEQMARDLGVEVGALVGNAELARRIEWKKYVTPEVGEPTLRDILDEMKKPGRDPRAEFAPPAFRDDVRTMEDLKPGMTLEGVVTNVTAFGAFVDIGVHQDGLVHVSQLSDKFIKDPKEVVQAGDKLKVRVLEIDMVRKRIALTARQGEGPKGGAFGKREDGAPRRGPGEKRGNDGPRPPSSTGAGFANRPFEALLKR